MQAVVFDLDGTLVDSEGAHARALDEIVRRRGYRSREGGYVGLTDRQALGLVFEDHGVRADPDEFRSIIDEKTALLAEILNAEGFRVYPGAVELVREIAQHVPVAVCTASSPLEANLAVDAMGLSQIVSTVITCRDVSKNKPHPEGYALAVARLGAEPARSIAVEDSANGLKAARAAGLHTVGLLHTCPREHLDLAHEIVGTIGELSVGRLRGMFGFTETARG
ncbi:HAD family phosphatase [Planctomycetaceae bacterium AH-315-I19]|nr:HAD family phosphatase [Planctomycetaceae bacterium AH-315-I19]